MTIDESAETALAEPLNASRKKKGRFGFIVRCFLVLSIIAGLGLIAYRGYKANQAANAAIAELTRLSTSPTLVDAIIAQNANTYKQTQADVVALDRRYQADVRSKSGLAGELMARPGSLTLRDYVDGAQDRIVLIMLMDRNGSNVATSRLTHDYWQGDEDKFTQTFPQGPGAVHWGGAERDDVTGRLMHVVARTVTDPKTGEPIGAIAVGYDKAALGR